MEDIGSWPLCAFGASRHGQGMLEDTQKYSQPQTTHLGVRELALHSTNLPHQLLVPRVVHRRTHHWNRAQPHRLDLAKSVEDFGHRLGGGGGG